MGYLGFSAFTLIFIHVIGIIAVFAMGYNLGQRKSELEQRQPSSRGARQRVR